MNTTSSLLTLQALKSARVSLRPITPDDYNILFLWHSDASSLHLWWPDRYILSFDEFIDDLRKRIRTYIHHIMMVEYTQGNEKSVVGMVYNYNSNTVDRYTYLCVYLPPEYRAQQIGPEAGYLFAEYLFAYYGFRKIYAEIYAFNEPSLKVCRKNGFVEEGRLIAHRRFGDRYWDLHILALTVDEFKKLPRP